MTLEAGRQRAALVFDRDSAYAEGYECGIADYCRMVHPEDEEPWPSGNDASRP